MIMTLSQTALLPNPCFFLYPLFPPRTMATATLSTYDKQAIKFLQDTDTSLEVLYVKHGKHFSDDKEDRDCYTVTISRNNRSFTVNFGQSILHSATREMLDLEAELLALDNDTRARFFGSTIQRKGKIKMKLAKLSEYVEQPSAYDVLACLQKNDPGTFAEFCSDFGYNEDTRTAERTYQAVKEEWLNIERLFTEKEIEELQKIQ